MKLTETLIGFILLTVVGCGTSVRPNSSMPGEVGNGGDGVRAKLERGRALALNAIFWTSERRLLGGAPVLEVDDAWFLERKEAMKEEVKSLSFSWANPSDNDRCKNHPGWQGCTEAKKGAVVWLLRARCEASSDKEIAELVLHEALHHLLGSDEDRVYRLASKIVRLWGQSTLLNAPVGLQLKRQSWGGQRRPLLVSDGRTLTEWNPCSESFVRQYFPDLRNKEVTLRPTPAWLTGDAPNPFQCDRLEQSTFAFAAVDGALFVFAEGGFGMRLDPASGHWEKLAESTWFPPRFSAPETAWGLPPSSALTMGNRALILGWAKPDETPWLGSFDAETRRWRQLPLGPIQAGTIFQGAALTGTSLILHHQTYAWSAVRGGLSVGHRLDLSTLAWSPMPERGAPDGLYSPTVIGGRNGALFYGGWRSRQGIGDENFYVRQGVYYDEEQNAWVEASPPEAMGPLPVGSQRVLGRREGDFFHLMGSRWTVWSSRVHQWETLDSNLGTLFADSDRLFDLGPTTLFWNQSRSAGLFLAR